MLSTERSGHRGDGGAPPVLLLHCWSHDRAMWGPQLHALITAGHDVTLMDLPGHGASPVLAAPFTFDDVVATVGDTAEQLGLRGAVVAGLSMGAAVAVQLALDRPAIVGALLLADSALPDGPARGELAAARIRSTPLVDLLDQYETVLFSPSHRAGEDRSAIDRWRRTAAAMGTEALAEHALALHGRRDPRSALPTIDVPTVVVHGSLDAAVPPDRRLDYLTIPGSRRHELPDAGHLSNLDAADAFTSLLSAFVAEVARRPGRSADA